VRLSRTGASRRWQPEVAVWVEPVGPALTKAIDAQLSERRTTVVEIMWRRELGDPVRKDALPKPVRLLEKYKDYV
jgi:sulfoacetaldehyde acetyltransferase